MSLPGSFWKMHAQGNDFVFMDVRGLDPGEDLPGAAIRLCDRRFGIGADGLVLVESPRAGGDLRMTIFNADGSRAEICGSALRCLTGMCFAVTGNRAPVIETDAGLHPGIVIQDHPLTVRVDMGAAQSQGMAVAEGFRGERVMVENPHFVVFPDAYDPGLGRRFGPDLEKAFPGGVNVHFARIDRRDALTLHTWERGAGATTACGSGACATVWSGIRNGNLDRRVRVSQPGGEVMVEYGEDGRLYLEGKVDFVFKGDFRPI